MIQGTYYKEWSSVLNREMEFKVYGSAGVPVLALPNDPIMLLSVVNLKLRDFYKNLDALCEDMDADKADLCAKLKAVGYEYDAQRNQFV